MNGSGNEHGNLTERCSRAGLGRPDLRISVALAAITLALYWPVINFEFVQFDDPSYVTLNSAVQAGLRFQVVLLAFCGFLFSYWHTLALLLH